MTTTPVTAAVLHDRADANHAAVDKYHAHHDACTKSWCALCTSLGREIHDAYQSALNAAATVRGAL